MARFMRESGRNKEYNLMSREKNMVKGSQVLLYRTVSLNRSRSRACVDKWVRIVASKLTYFLYLKSHPLQARYLLRGMERTR